MYVISFCFDSKLVLEKAEKPASYELARHTAFSKYFTYLFLKESSRYFQMNILTDFIPPSSLQQQGSLFLRSFISSKTSLLTSIPENFSPWLWL